MPTLEQTRILLTEARELGYGSRRLAHELKLHQVAGLNARFLRHCMAGKQQLPEVVYRAIHDIIRSESQ